MDELEELRKEVKDLEKERDTLRKINELKQERFSLKLRQPFRRFAAEHPFIAKGLGLKYKEKAISPQTLTTPKPHHKPKKKEMHHHRRRQPVQPQYIIIPQRKEAYA